FTQNRRFDSAPEWIRRLGDAQQLYLAGGGYLTDLFWMGFILQPIQYALKMKVPVISAPVGVGPFKSPSNADEAIATFRQIKLTVRDQVSMDFCRTYGIDAALAPDDAFAFVKNLLPSLKPPSARPRKIGVCIFNQYNQDPDLTGWWTACLRGLKAQHPEYEIEGFCFHTSLQDEFQEMTRLFSQAGLPPEQVLAPTTDFRKAAGAIRGYDLVISARFHAIITANVFNIPSIAIAASDYYQAKMNAARLGFENICSPINPASQPPEDLLNICKSRLSSCEIKKF
ncbi:MAG TPA: polysaccharide pyruvyl transferase family protein, partial [Pseudomonadales bacterium]|nr:polysaccharide pyruvyl transferase family protein [Pseudomonadales bacterium]